MDMNGVIKGIEKIPDVSLLDVNYDGIITALGDKFVQKFSEGGTRKVVILKQEDREGLHQDARYLRRMEEEFKN